MRKSQRNNARIYERNIVESLAWRTASSKSPVGRLPLSCASDHISKTMARQRKKGRGKMADERNEMMERGNTRREVQPNEKEGRKGKQVELLMLAIMFLPG